MILLPEVSIWPFQKFGGHGTRTSPFLLLLLAPQLAYLDLRLLYVTFHQVSGLSFRVLFYFSQAIRRSISASSTLMTFQHALCSAAQVPSFELSTEHDLRYQIRHLLKTSSNQADVFFSSRRPLQAYLPVLQVPPNAFELHNQQTSAYRHLLKSNFLTLVLCQ